MAVGDGDIGLAIAVDVEHGDAPSPAGLSQVCAEIGLSETG